MHYVQVDNGIRCAVEDIQRQGRQCCVFVHGWPLTRQIFEYQFETLIENNIRCVFYDIRGFGDSDKPAHGYTYDRLADDLCNILQSINVRCVTLFGFSMGGAICCRYLSRHNHYKVKSLVLCGAACPVFVQTPDSPYGIPREQVDQMINQTREDRPAMYTAFGQRCFASHPSQPLKQWFNRQSEAAAGYATIKALQALRDEQLYEDCASVRIPTAIFHGVQDQICPFPLAQETNELISNSFIVPFENSGHCLFYDEKRKCNNQLIQFIDNY